MTVGAIDLDGVLALERSVWDALVAGDGAADRALLDPDFLGVYPTGFGDRGAHVDQVADGPTVASYDVTDARLRVIAEGHVLLAYRATYRRPDRPDPEEMFVSSLWSRSGDTWRNTFSQDTPVGDAVV